MNYYQLIRNLDYSITKDTLKVIFNFSLTNFGIYILWIFMHYISSHLYIHWCVPATIFGFIISPFIIPAPHCVGLRWMIHHGGNSIIAMWSIIGVWILGRIIPINRNN